MTTDVLSECEECASDGVTATATICGSHYFDAVQGQFYAVEEAKRLQTENARLRAVLTEIHRHLQNERRFDLHDFARIVEVTR